MGKLPKVAAILPAGEGFSCGRRMAEYRICYISRIWLVYRR